MKYLSRLDDHRGDRRVATLDVQRDALGRVEGRVRFCGETVTRRADSTNEINDFFCFFFLPRLAATEAIWHGVAES